MQKKDDTQLVPRSTKKKDLEDFFPRTKKELPGYICKECFKNQLTKIFEIVLAEQNLADQWENKAFQSQESGFCLPVSEMKKYHFSQDDHSFKNRNSKSDLKEKVLAFIEISEWYSFEKMEMADKMFEESKKYGEAVALELISLGASGLFSQVSKDTKFLSKIGIGKNVQKFIQAEPIKGSFGVFEYALSPFNIGFTHVATAASKIGMDKWIDTPSKDDGHVNENNSNQKFEAVDCMKAPKNIKTPKGIIGMGASFLGNVGRLFSPHLNFAAAVVNMGYNALLSNEYFTTGKRIRAIEEETNRKNAEFLSKLKQYIYDDFSELRDDEIESLIELLWKNKKNNEYKPLWINFTKC